MPESGFGAYNDGHDVRSGLSAGGARRHVTFLEWPRKVTKRRPPRFRRNPGILAFAWGSERTRCAQTPFAGLRQPQPKAKIPVPAEGRKTVAHHRFSSPLSRQFFRGRSGEVGEHCLSPQGELRSRPNGLGKIGYPKGDEAGRAFFGYFLCTSKESNALPGAPGQSPYPHKSPHHQAQQGKEAKCPTTKTP
mgnify:CR=1 FL=1